MASSAKVEVRALPPGPAKSGAGGNGLRGLPPYAEEGVPGRGFPLIFIGSKFGGAALVGLHARVGDSRLLRLEKYDVSGGGIDGMLIMDGARDGASTDG